MKPFILSFVAVLCAIQATEAVDSLRVLQAKASLLKTRVNGAIGPLERITKFGKNDLETKLIFSKSDRKMDINNIINPAMSEIRAAAEAAKQAGKDRDHCVETGRLALRAITQSGFNRIDDCARNAINLLDPVLSNCVSAIQTGNSLKSEIDAAFFNCNVGGIYGKEICISNKLATIGLSVDNLQSTSRSIQSAKDTAASNAASQANRCYPPIVSSVRDQVPEPKNSALNCISN